MVRPAAAAFLAVLLAGVALIGYAVATGAASLALVLIIPVVWGSSLALALGVLLAFVGLVGLLGTLAPVAAEEEGPSPPPAGSGTPPPAATTGCGGFVLLGPVPLFFGSARPFGRRYYVWALLAGAALFVLLVLVARAL
jgi:uncharacterized membrane protein